MLRYSPILIAVVLMAVVPARSQPEISLVGYMPVGTFATDVWEYVDPATDDVYALVGSSGGVWVIDVTDPANPNHVTTIDIPEFDFKTWGSYLYGVTGGGGTNDGRIVDMTDPLNPSVVGSFDSAHNIWISETGYLYAEFPGLQIYDLNPDPTDPQLVWDGGNSGGHDAATIGDRLFDFSGTSATNIYQITEGTSFSLDHLGTINDPSIVYHHSGWTTEDGQYLFICDELASHPRADISVWDISDPGNPSRVDEYADPDATVHNLYVIGDYAFVAYYTAGFRVFDVGTTPGTITMVDEYDTSPSTGEGFGGAFGVYPFSETGNIYVSDDEGLFIFTFGSSTIACGDIDLFQARCVSGGTIQARAVLLNSTEYAGEEVTIRVDGVDYPLIVGTNGTHSRAALQLPGQAIGDHTVELVDPAGCFDPVEITCTAGLGNMDEDWLWNDGWGDYELTTEANVPLTTAILGNYPNPFNPSTTISYALAGDGFVSLKVYNTLGQEVATLVNEFQQAGAFTATWNGTNDFGSTVSSGIYIYRLQTSDIVITEKMMMMK